MAVCHLVFFSIPVPVETSCSCLEMEFDDILKQKDVNPNDIHFSTKYRLKNPPTVDKSLLYSDEAISTGIMSPTSDVTLPPHYKEKGGIPELGTKFALLHAPPHLADYLSNNGKDLQKNMEDSNFWLYMFSIFGAFIYFDKDMNAVGINVLCPLKAKHKFELDGPYPSSEAAVREVTNLNRLSHIPVEFCHEMGVMESVSTKTSYMNIFRFVFATSQYLSNFPSISLGKGLDQTRRKV